VCIPYMIMHSQYDGASAASAAPSGLA